MPADPDAGASDAGMPETDSTDAAAEDEREFAAELASMWDHRRAGFAERADAVEAAVVATLAGALDEEQRLQAEREAHKLAGSLGTYGIPGGSEIARELEDAFRSRAPALESAPRLAELVLALQRAIARGPAVPPEVGDAATAMREDAPIEDGRDALLIVTPDDALAERLLTEAAARGLTGRRQVPGQDPAGESGTAVVDLGPAAPGATELRGLEHVARGLPRPATLVLSARDTFEDRLAAARRGADAFLTRSTPPGDVIAAATGLRDRRRTAEARVLALDDDPAVLDALERVLAPGRTEVIAVAHAQQLWEVLADAEPDLVVLDVDMPAVDGTDLCRVIRSHPRYAELPVLFLTGRTDAAALERIFAAGADDYVAKPIVAAEVLGRIHNRIERARLMRQLADNDALTGLANRRRASRDIVRSLALSDRYGHSVSLALLDIDRFKAINDRHGHAVGDAVLRALAELLARSFRGEDTVGRWGGEEFVVCLYGAGAGDGADRIGDALRRFASVEIPTPHGPPIRASFSAGVAEYRTDATDPQSLHRAADAALHAAKAAGRNRVFVARDSPAATRVVDVVVVEDDETVADLLVHALETRGYKTAHLADGAEAAEALEGPTPRLRARVALMDVDLPGIDGISVLRRLARGGTLPDLAVIMLTVRAAEAEVLEALELGAVDHVAKPFSVPVLLQRVRHVLEGPR